MLMLWIYMYDFDIDLPGSAGYSPFGRTSSAAVRL
jgi:hypothetical protein